MYFVFFRYSFNPLSAFVRFFINLRHYISKEKDRIIPFNHIGNLMQDKSGDWFIYESSGGPIRKYIAHKRLKNKIICICPINNAGDFVHSNALDYAEHKIGRVMYDTIALIWHQLLFQVFGIWYGHSGSLAEEKQYCSEYSANIFNAGYKSKIGLPHLTDPEDIWNGPYIESYLFFGKVKKVNK
jgi:hypothetical protein